MITEKLAKQIFAPLRGMPMEPTEPAIIRTRIESLAKHARSEGHGRRAVDHLVSTLQFFPTVAEIIQACEYSPDDESMIEKRKNCQQCGGNGWISVDRGDTSVAVRCDHSGCSGSGEMAAAS